MKMKRASVASVLACVLMVGCAGKPTLYYTLADSVVPTNAPTVAAIETPVYFEMAPLALPERLARPQMVVRKPGGDSTQVFVLEQHRWASSFEAELRDALASGLTAQLGAIDVTKGGRLASTPVYRIAVQVRQFDAIEGARIDGSFSWTIRRTDETRTTACQLSINQPLGAGMDGVAQGARRLTGDLAAAIARSMMAPTVAPAAGCGP